MSWLKPRKSAKQREFEAEALVHLDSLYAHALRLTRSPSDAEDLVQDTFVRALRFYERFERGTNLKAWLLRIQFNSFVNKYRRNVKEVSAGEAMSHEPATESTLGRGPLQALLDPHGVAIAPILAQEIQAALAKLPEDHQTVVLLADVEELSYKEIAEVIGCPIGTVMSRLHRARKALQERLSEQAEALGLTAATGSVESQNNEPIMLAKYRRERSQA
ncbi:MAG TPA: sigma-70 family RNA polymerase sigma factor [Polyangiales bacterium]|nr:sigma-70 family RNA polymerase sigma factor [Polyangiales bacterium]